MKGIQQLFFLISTILLLISCENNKWKQDTSHIDYNPELKRMEFDFFSKGKDGFTEAELTVLKELWEENYNLYLKGVLRLGSIDSLGLIHEASRLISNKDVQDLYESVVKKYPKGELNQERTKIIEAIKQMKMHFPEVEMPQLYTMISLFTYNVVVDNNFLGISLDMYMGGNYKYYPSTGIPQYKFKNFERAFIVGDAIKAFLIAEFDNEGGRNLIEEMIFYGKIAYLQSAFLEEEEHIYFNYTPDELEWCEKNEAEIWFHLVDMDLLYTVEAAKIRKYMDDAPFIPGFPEGSSARVGKWIGYRIVKSYMEQHSNMSLHELMQMDNANELLLKSKYKPNR